MTLHFSPKWFSQQVIDYAKAHGRFDLPWKTPPTAYRVWISEVMLQQTQVQTVLSYFERFLRKFPTVQELAAAHIDEVLEIWAGLGYYRRAHFIHQTAQKIVTDFQGVFPNTLEDLMSLQGIGRSTAGAILAQAFKISAPILDGNVKRVLARMIQLEAWPEQPSALKHLWFISESVTPLHEVELYTQGIMDLGATLCTKKQPLCTLCPLTASCLAFKANTQSYYPYPKPKKEKPLRRCYFLIILNEKEEVLLVKRPERGIWGGLWSLPARPISNPDIACVNSNRSLIEPIKMGPKFKHTFSHFNLEYKPIVVQTRGFKFLNREQAWFKQEDMLKIGLPAPIKKLMNGEFSWKTEKRFNA